MFVVVVLERNRKGVWTDTEDQNVRYGEEDVVTIPPTVSAALLNDGLEASLTGNQSGWKPAPFLRL